MTIRSVLEIDLRDERFHKFMETFKHYQKLLGATSAEWKKVSDTVGGTRSAWEALVASQTAILARSKLIGEAQKEAARRSKTLADDWHKLAGSAKSFAGFVVHATRQLLSWGGLTTALSGLLGGGALLGFDRLAQIASAGRRSALGLGLTFGEQGAFGVNYSRVVEPGQFLGGVNQALHDVTKRYTLYGAGLTEADLRGKDTAQVAAALLPALKRLADRTPENQLAQVMQARGLGQFISLQDFERIKNLSPRELASYQRHFAQDTIRLGLTQQQLAAWQRLQVQLTRAGDTIESSLIRGLGRLTPGLKKLSQSFTDVVDAFLNSKDLKRWINVAADDLEAFAKYIGTPQFKTDVDKFITGIGHLANEVDATAKWINSMLPAKYQVQSAATIGAGGVAGYLLGGPVGAAVGAALGLGYSKSQHIDPRTFNRAAPLEPFSWWKPWTWLHHSNGGAAPSNIDPWTGALLKPSAYRTLEGAYNLPGGILPAVARAESGGNPLAVSRAGAMGLFQFTPGTWARYGHGSPFDPNASAQAAGSYLSALLREFGGSVDKALAAYNWGPGNVERDIARFGDAWRQHLPAETKQYLARILPQIAGSQRSPRIMIEDRTGGSVVITGAQLAV